MTAENGLGCCATIKNPLYRRAGDVFDWDLWVDSVLVEEIDAISSEALEHAFDGQLDVVGGAVQGRRMKRAGGI
jgi:hypothetical protein